MKVRSIMPIPYVELPTIALIDSLEKLDPVAYLAANPDLRAAKVEAISHFAQYGIHEGRRQFVNAAEIEKLRCKKLEAISFRAGGHPISAVDGPRDFISKNIKDNFEIPDFPPVVANEYHFEIVELIRANPNKLFLDVGAGLRHTYYSNVVNAEIWPSVSTDVVCIGEDLPFSDSQFDYIICLAVLEHTKQPWLAVKEIIRVAKPGGVLRIDWPFLQPVHGYPHHYFNATLKGNLSQFSDHCDIISCGVRPWQHPIYSITWILHEWRSGLPEGERAKFDQIKVGDILGVPPQQQMHEAYCAQLSDESQQVIAAGTTLIARKR